MGYFLQVLDFEPLVLDGSGKRRPPSEFKTLSFGSTEAASSALCALNSSLFYWFVTVFSDCRHLNKREVEAFPLNLERIAFGGLGRQLVRLSSELMDDFKLHSVERKMRFAHDTLTVQCIFPRHSKVITDNIDAVLAEYYQLTKDELDFVTNYDVKYRLGADDEEVNVKLEGDLTTLHPATAFLPTPLDVSIETRRPDEFWAAGRTELLNQSKIGFFCSSQCPGSIVLKTFDAVTKMRDEGQVLIGGFHSVMEWECLRILLRGRQPIIWVPARTIVGMRLKPELQPAFKEGRLLILSPFPPGHNRITANLAQQRNRFVGFLADSIFVPHAATGSRTELLVDLLRKAGKEIRTLAPSN